MDPRITFIKNCKYNCYTKIIYSFLLKSYILFPHHQICNDNGYITKIYNSVYINMYNVLYTNVRYTI